MDAFCFGDGLPALNCCQKLSDEDDEEDADDSDELIEDDLRLDMLPPWGSNVN